MRLITLTTDFGHRDWFVGTMKQVIHGIAPDARVIDLTHAIAPGAIREGAFALMAGIQTAPPEAIHVAVVDPGVGSERQAIALKCSDAVLVGPDNGLLSWSVRGRGPMEVRRLENPDFWRQPVSRTFHGRDVFAPVAAHLARGVSFEELGPIAPAMLELPWPEPEPEEKGWRGEVLYVDHFGNALTNLPAGFWTHEVLATEVVLESGQILTVAPCYAAVEEGQPLGLISSSGYLEVAIHGGSARKVLGLEPGARVHWRPL